MNDTPLRNEAGPRDWEPSASELIEGRFVVGPRRAGDGWRIATLVFGVSTFVLTALLAGQVEGMNQLVQQGGLATPRPPVTETVWTVPDTRDLSPILNSLSLSFSSHYSEATGWPTSITMDGARTARTSDGFILGSIPIGCYLQYDAPDTGGYSLWLMTATGAGAGFATSDYQAPASPENAAQIVGPMASLLKEQADPPWPSSLSMDEFGNVSLPGGLPLGMVPRGSTLDYSANDEGTSFELTLKLADGSGAHYSSVTDQVDEFG